MDNHDKLFNQIKNASQKQEVKDFAALDKVWARVEDKLDNKVLQKEKHLWKKIAVAASFLLLFTVGYQLLKPKENLAVPINTIAVKDTVNNQLTPVETLKTEQEIAAENPNVINQKQRKSNPIIKTEAAEILKGQLKQKTEVAIENSIRMAQPNATSAAPIKAQRLPENAASYETANREEYDFLRREKKAARSVAYKEQEISKSAKKTAPLVVIDGNALTSKNGQNDKAVKDGFSKLAADEIEDIVVLKEPLYIINGQYYSEEELFGPNPTSPYAPLNKQEIETISILQGEKAIEVYGKDGSKGVVIISTKNQKPVNQAAEKGK